MSSATRLVFVGGTGRCGSTVVEEILARHPAMGFVSNVEDNVRALDRRDHWNGAIYRRLPAALTQKGRLRYAPSEAYVSLARDVSPTLVDPARDLTAEDLTPWLASRLRGYFGERAAAQRCEVFVHKFTGWPRIGLLHAAFPDARFIHIVRDGRAVANSWLQMPWWRGHLGPERWHFGPLPAPYATEWEDSGQRFDLLAGLAWKLLIDAQDDAVARLPEGRCLELRFEDVVARPRESLDRMLTFCDLEWNAEFGRAFDRVTLRRDRLDAFQADLGPESTALLTASLAEHLAARGYRVESPA